MDLLIFDLDGTLIDSRLDLAHSVNAARAHMGMASLDNELVASYVGNGAPVLIRRALGDTASEAEVQEALDLFLEHYREHALDNTALYPGVREALDRLRAGGKRLAVLTNKPVKISRAIVSGLGVGDHFFQVYGGNSFEFKKPNPVGVERLIEEAGVDRERTLMVGDSSVDIQTARNARVRSCGVTYGFQPDSLVDPAPDLLVGRMEELADWVLDTGGGKRPPAVLRKRRQTMTYKPGADVPADGIYWCTVCKLPERFAKGQRFPECGNMCGRGRWELVEDAGQSSHEPRP